MPAQSPSDSQPIFAGRDVAQRIEGVNARALTEHVSAMNRLYPEIGAAALPVAGGIASFVGVDMPVSYAVGLGFAGAVSDEDAANIVDFYRSRGAVPRVDVCPLAHESVLASLRAKGFQVHRFVNVLARALSPHDEIPALPEGVVLREVSASEAELWITTVDAGFFDGQPITERGRRLATMMFHLPRTFSYLAEWNGRVAGAAQLFTDGGYAALSAASVLPECRRHGVHTALIRARLKRAIALGCDIAGVFTDPGSNSQRNAERHGFRLMYSKAILKAE